MDKIIPCRERVKLRTIACSGPKPQYRLRQIATLAWNVKIPDISRESNSSPNRINEIQIA